LQGFHDDFIQLVLLTLPDLRGAHGKDKNTHDTAFVVRILMERTAKGARRIFTR
jgi:hypothetical protein